jgi:hypothetical protein
MPVPIHSNFAEAKLSVAPTGTGGLTFSVAAGKGALFPSPVAGTTHFFGTFVNATKTVREIVEVEARSTDAFTIATGGRGKDGTTAQTWTTNDTFYLGVSNAMLAESSLAAASLAISALVPAADRMPYFTSATAGALATLTAFARTFLDDVDGPAVCTTIGAVEKTGTALVTITQSSANTGALIATGNGTGRGVTATGGATNATGVQGTGGATNGVGVAGIGTGTGAGVTGTGGATNAAGVTGTGGATNGAGVVGTGAGTGVGVNGTGGGTNAAGVTGTGGATSGVGVQGTGTGPGAGVRAIGGASSGIGVLANGTGSGATGGDFTGGSSGVSTGVIGRGGAVSGYGVIGTAVNASYGGVQGIAQNGTIFGILGYNNTYGLYSQGPLATTITNSTSNVGGDYGVVPTFGYLTNNGVNHIGQYTSNSHYVLVATVTPFGYDLYTNHGRGIYLVTDTTAAAAIIHCSNLVSGSVDITGLGLGGTGNVFSARFVTNASNSNIYKIF